MTDDALKITAYLASPLAGAAPLLDALLEWAMSVHVGETRGEWKVDRRRPAPGIAEIPIPILRVRLGGWPIACCSSPILPTADAETVEHVTKRIATEHADLLAPEERRVIDTTSTWTKSYRLPVQVRRVSRVVWFARGNRHGLMSLLKQIDAIGTRPKAGYGRVKKWDVERGAPEAWWYADSPAGLVLMRPLPLCDELPRELVGYRRDYGACCAPYWHPERLTDVVVPC